MNISSLSMKELLHRVNVTDNAFRTIPELKAALKTLSWDEQKMQIGIDLAKDVNEWISRQQATRQQAIKTQAIFKDTKRSINALYMSHVRTARFAYAEDRVELRKLMLVGPRASRYTNWLEQIRVFYTSVDQKALTKYGLPKAEIEEVQALLGKLLELEVLRNQAKWKAQEATDGKNAAVEELRTWFRRFIQIARLACVDNPQLLESIGLVVKAQ